MFKFFGNLVKKSINQILGTGNFYQIGILKEIVSNPDLNRESNIYPLFIKREYPCNPYEYYILIFEYTTSREITKKEFKKLLSYTDNGEIKIDNSRYQVIRWRQYVPYIFSSLNTIFRYVKWSDKCILVRENPPKIEFILLQMETNNGPKYFAFHPKYWIIPVEIEQESENRIARLDGLEDEFGKLIPKIFEACPREMMKIPINRLTELDLQIITNNVNFLGQNFDLSLNASKRGKDF